MGFINETSRILNEAAFGDIRNIFRRDGIYEFMLRPIGLVQKSYDLAMWNLQRNIGNSAYIYDGYGTPIGELANPFYNTITEIPWFYLDADKNNAATYFEYIKNTYGAALSVENINKKDLFRIGDDASKVGSVDGALAIEAMHNNVDFLPNPNLNQTNTDSKLGWDSGYFTRETLRNTWASNINKNNNFSITSNISDYLGLTTKNITKNRTYEKTISSNTGRLEDGIDDETKKNFFSPTEFYDSPVYTSNWGNIGGLGSYSAYYDFLTEKGKEFYNNNAFRKGFKNFKYNRNHHYLNRINNPDGVTLAAVDEINGRYIFTTLSEQSNISDSIGGGVYVYAEEEDGKSHNIENSFNIGGIKYSLYTSYSEGLAVNDLIKKTNDSFKNGRFKTIIARFNTGSDGIQTTDTTQTAISKRFGMSHGRNLLKANPDDNSDDTEGYRNPYCRVWTFHHQYHRLKDAIRPFKYTAEELYNDYNFNAFTADHEDLGNGRERLEKHGVLNKKNGLVNITPIDDSDVSRKVDIKNCMFSIENLAWKDVFSTDAASRDSFQAGGLSPEQKGPFGGRIMWFPPYDLKFNEDVSVNWNETNFIGRGEGIYTYTNTTRSGDLSFKLLVDHPSVIDYWENRGQSKSNSVDVTSDPEQQLLRFFAGCDMLTAKPMPTPEEEAAVHDEANKLPDIQEIVFFVFFPNNYSGVDDGYDFALKYLTNGLGAGKELVDAGKIEDYKIPYANAKNGYGGYEMRPEKPISLGVTEQDPTLFIGNTKVGNNQKDTLLYAQQGNSTNEWYQRKWYYRVDNDYINDDLLKKNYIDRKSFCLNSSAGQEQVAKSFSIKDTNSLFSLADVYVAYNSTNSTDNNSASVLDKLYNPEKSKRFRELTENSDRIVSATCMGMASVHGTTKENNKLEINRAKTVKDWLCNVCKFDSNKVEAISGGEGGKGPGVNNGDVNEVINKLWRSVKVTIGIKSSESDVVQNTLKEQDVNIGSDINKDYREVNIINQPISYTRIKSNEPIGRNNTWIDVNNSFNNFNQKDYALKSRLVTPGENINNKYFGLKFTGFTYNNETSQFEGGIETINKRGKDDYRFNFLEFKDNEDSLLRGQLDEDEINDTEISTRNNEIDKNVANRYDNESKFFSMLEKEAPFLHHKISDKIKYFDPAFHSISPEGFNARLTFLQQCTRQGPTIGSSDNYTENNTANNLAFGRPPVCILRIGDFYYTKILIEGLRISFDPLMWDLNQEGIGVMPMICDVNLRFKFIGGSSLAGHITRLQNALSFNYYANTEVYDNRSELAEYDENGNIAKFKPYNPTN